MKVFTFRNILGALLLLVFVGEPTVGSATGLFTFPGFIVLFVMYLLLFLTYELFIDRYQLTYGKLAWLNTAIYSIIITGLLHGELADFAKPDRFVITALIRVQCIFFPLFAYYVLNKLSKVQRKPVKGRNLMIAWGAFILILSTTPVFGLQAVMRTVKSVPVIVFVSVLVAAFALWRALHPSHTMIRQPYKNTAFTYWCYALGILGLIPTLQTLMALLLLMPMAAAYYLYKPDFRNTLV